MDDESKAGDAAPESGTYVRGNRVIRRTIRAGDSLANQIADRELDRRIADAENVVVMEKNQRIEELEAELADMKSASAPRGKEAEELRAGIERIIKERPSDENAGDIYWARALQTMLDEVDARDSYSYLTVLDEVEQLRAYRDSTHDAEERIKTALDQLDGSHPLELLDCIERAAYMFEKLVAREEDLRAARGEILRLHGPLTHRAMEHESIALAINLMVTGPENDEKRRQLQTWLNAQVKRAIDATNLEMMIVDVADDTLGLQEVCPSDELLSRLNQRVVNDHEKIRALETTNDGFGKRAMQHEARARELESNLESKLDEDARHARNVLGQALIQIDGHHSSALTICADRAAELLTTQVTLLGEQKLSADIAAQEVKNAQRDANKLRAMLMEWETKARLMDQVVAERDELQDRLAKEQTNREMFEERAVFAEAEQRKAAADLAAMRQADEIVTRNFKFIEERSRQWQDESHRARRERNLRVAERDEAWAQIAMLARHLYGCVQLARTAVNVPNMDQLDAIEKIATASMADALVHNVAVMKGCPPHMLLGYSEPRTISDVLARRIDLDMMGPKIPDSALDGLYPEAEIRQHFYDVLGDLTRLTTALDRLFPNRPRAGVGSIDGAIGLVEQLKRGRDEACELVMAFFEEMQSITAQVAQLGPEEKGNVSNEMLDDSRKAMESIRAKVDQLLAIGVES